MDPLAGSSSIAAWQNDNATAVVNERMYSVCKAAMVTGLC